MEVAYLPRQSRHYQLPTSALTPLSLPNVGAVMREAQAQLFIRDYVGLVDHQAHSMLCREALEAGLVAESSSEWLRQYPNSYGLHRLTSEVVQRLGASFAINDEGLFPQRSSLLNRLSTPYVDPVETASYAIGAVEAGLIGIDALAPHIEVGPAGAGRIMGELERSLIDRIKLPTAVKEAYSFGIQDGHFILESSCFASFSFQAPASLELRVLLFKTLDAMTRHLLPFHTPMTFLGPHSYLNHGLSEAFEELAPRLATHSREELCAFLLDDSVEHDDYIAEYLYCHGQDEDSVNSLLDAIYEMDELKKIAGATLSQGDRLEIEELSDQARQICERDDAHAPLIQVLRDALQHCLEQDASGLLKEFNPHDLPGTAGDGVSLFESILVCLTRDFPNLEQSSYDGFEGIVSGCGFPAIGLPLSSDQLRTVTLPVLDALSLTLGLLQRIADALEECGNAE
ncbi:hypothetical protein DB395_32245 [Pseudomonas aeruginosa]|nr:hypothetical protein DB395_32245 [Pseudomonas aeruginosa]